MTRDTFVCRMCFSVSPLFCYYCYCTFKTAYTSNVYSYYENTTIVTIDLDDLVWMSGVCFSSIWSDFSFFKSFQFIRISWWLSYYGSHSAHKESVLKHVYWRAVWFFNRSEIVWKFSMFSHICFIDFALTLKNCIMTLIGGMWWHHFEYEPKISN